MACSVAAARVGSTCTDRHGDHPGRIAWACVQVWNTFSKEQIDMDVFNEKGREYIERELTSLMDRCAPRPLLNLARAC